MTSNETAMHLQRAAHLREQAQGLLRLAEMIEATPDLDACYIKPGQRLEINGWHAPSPEQMAAIARAALAHGAKIEKSATTDIYALTVSWGPFAAEAIAARESVCERVVTGTETVTKTVPDPDALAAVPTVEVTEEVERVEWVCRPLLAAEANDSNDSEGESR